MPKSKQNKGKQGQGQGQGQNKGQAKSKVRPDEDLEEEEDNEEDNLDLMDDNEEDDDVDDFDDEDDELFWTLVVAPNKEVMLEEPANPNSIICVTHASFGEEVNKDSRTILYCATSASENPVPICILSNGIHESHPLNLRFGSPASFSLKGRNPSTVYLSGYLQPELSSMMDGMNDMEDMEDIEDMDEDVDLEEEEPRFPGKSRKRGAPEEDIEEPTAKKRKIEAKAVETKKAESKKNTPNKPQPQQPQQSQQSQQSTPANNQSATATAASTAASTATSTPGGDKPLSKNQLKKQKKLQKQQGKSDDKPKEDEKTQPQETVTSTPSHTTEKKTEETPKAPEQDASKSQKSTDTKKSNDVEIKDIKVGTGAVVQNGQTLNLYFVGQLEDKTVFEKHLTGNGFEFKLGSQDAIKGWNLGLKGMKVGGKRRIVVPAKLAYGEQGNEEKKIPANSTLTFTVEVREAK